MPSVLHENTLNNGKKMPLFGLGTGCLDQQADPDAMREAVKHAIDIGYRLFDCAYVYFSEEHVGQGIKAKIEEGVVKRSDLFISSKLWSSFHRRDLVRPALKKSLANLRLEYLDLYLIHWPTALRDGTEPPRNSATPYPVGLDGRVICSDVDICETWKAMEDCVNEGLVRSIGLSNFNSVQIDKILEVCKIKPVNNQVESHPFLPQTKLLEFCRERDITLTAYSPLGCPKRPWSQPDEPVLLEDQIICDMARKYEKTPAQVVLRFHVQRGVTCIPKTANRERLLSNFQALDFSLSPEDMTALSNHSTSIRYVTVEQLKHHPNYPFHIEF